MNVKIMYNITYKIENNMKENSQTPSCTESCGYIDLYEEKDHINDDSMSEISALTDLDTMTEPDTQPLIAEEDSMASTSSASQPDLLSTSTSHEVSLLNQNVKVEKEPGLYTFRIK